MRDYDREALSKQAFEDCCAVLSRQLESVQRTSETKGTTSISPQELLMRIFNIRQQCFKMSVKHLDAMMLQLYVILFPQKVRSLVHILLFSLWKVTKILEHVLVHYIN